ncbi:putative WRKY transcription factor 25 [Dorcoceras hygrometricum]|uniref:Putative WRKY transcription factor 25 n=1 Tax=Dorcoceras hygrometricum TaxID=472368 RepID=A0A2Z7A6R6_9LAMI|nr:putative WRKY transcription factor 25 [Dorcoceras hygrometricum]
MYAAKLSMKVRSSISYIFPSSTIGKDPLEGFDYRNTHSNPLLRLAATRTPSHHYTPARKLRI